MSKKQAPIPTTNSVSFHLFSRDLLSCLRFTFFEANTSFRLTLNHCGNFNLHCTVSFVLYLHLCAHSYCTFPMQQAVSSARCFCRKKSPALLPAHPMSPYNLFLHSVTDSSSKLFAIWNIVLCFCPPVLSMSPYPTTCFYIDSSSLKSAFFTSWSF